MTIIEQMKFIDDYEAALNAATGSAVDSNANVVEKNIATLGTELDKPNHIELQRAMMRKYLIKLYGEEFADQYEADLKHHIIYRHDETAGSGGFPYCVAMSMYPFLLDGLTKVGGGSTAPHHLKEFVGGFCNLMFIVAAQFAGAVASPEFLTYFDHFARNDYGQDYIQRLDEVIEPCRGLTMREMLTGYFGQVVYTINQPAAARGNQSIFWNIAYFDSDYFSSIFEGFMFPDGDEPKWESVKELQKLFMDWFNKERLRNILTFPVETANMHTRPLTEQEKAELTANGVSLVDSQGNPKRAYADEEMAQFFCKMWSEGASFFMYQSDSVDALSSCCRLRNAVEREPFSYTLGAGGVETGSKAVITMNLNRIIQDWANIRIQRPALTDYIAEITTRIHKYLTAFNAKLWDDFKAGMLTIYNAGFIELDKQYLTVGINGFIEAAEYLRIPVRPEEPRYRQLAADILGTIGRLNDEHKTQHEKFNTEFVPAENLAIKFYNWDKRDGYIVPLTRNCYNSYFYPVEVAIDPVKRFYYQGYGFADQCSGGVALHNNLEEHLDALTYRKLMDVALDAGCNYFTYNVRNTVCRSCGHIDKHTLDECPVCHGHALDYASRVIGYLKLVSNFSEQRQIEAGRRAYTSPVFDAEDLD